MILEHALLRLTLQRRNAILAMKGMSLTELIVTMVIVSFMVGGIFAASHSVLSMDKSGTGRSAVFIRAQAIVDTIKSDAVMATGASSIDPGILTDNSTWVCFRTGLPSATPWVCYSKADAAVSSPGNILYRCNNLASIQLCTAATSNTSLGIVDSGFGSVSINNGVFTMPVIVSDPAIVNSAVTLDVVAYPEGVSN